MLAKKCTISELESALNRVNLEFEDNLKFRRIDSTSRGVRFTLTVKDSHKKGSRLSICHFDKQRHIAAACWHAYGRFFECLFEIQPEAVAYPMHKPITSGFKWEDRNIGSIAYPFMYSEACECNWD